MKQYYTLIQEFCPKNDRSLSLYLKEQGIRFQEGADFDDDLKEYGYQLPFQIDKKLMSRCIVLIEEHELSAIMLSVGGVTTIKNRPFINAKNKVRGWFKWIVN